MAGSGRAGYGHGTVIGGVPIVWPAGETVIGLSVQ
jgi:hypothetical protein